jgi:carbohydrate kinase (thermoresistant glucokinase family)
MNHTEPTDSHLHVVVMGVAGTGKSTVAEELATALHLELTEGDDHHPAANIEKMSAGIPLTDEDRAPWLAELAAWTAQRHAGGTATVLTCSALRRRYRDVLRGGVPEPTLFVHLVGSRNVLIDRMTHRDHFMPASLLDSQFDTLEELEPDEHGGTVDTDGPLERVVADAVALVRRLAGSRR